MDPLLDVGIHGLPVVFHNNNTKQTQFLKLLSSYNLEVTTDLGKYFQCSTSCKTSFNTGRDILKLDKLTENSAFEVYYSSFSPNECFIYITKIIVVEIDFLSTVLFTRVDSRHYSCFQGIIYPDKFDHHLEMKNFEAYSCSFKFRRNYSNSL